MLRPILVAIILGLLAAYILFPLFLGINKIIHERNLATIILIIAIILIVFIPIWFFVPIILKQGFETFSQLQKIDIGSKVSELLSFLSSKPMLSSISAGVNNLITKTFTSFLNELTNLIVNLPNLLLQFTVFLFVFFFAIRDSSKLSRFILELSPFSASTEKELGTEFRKITNIIIYGQILIGIIQGLCLGLGLFVLGIPNALTLTIISVIVSIIPIMGAWFVWVPVSLVLIVTGDVFSGVILILYGALFVSIIDNILRFVFLSKNSRLNIPLSVIGLIGGLYTFGIIGLILGPLIISYVIVFISLYKEGKFKELFKK
jgi:predicted PurR-regulated permease PerM